MADQNVNIFIKARDDATAVFNKVRASAKRMGQGIRGIQGDVRGVVATVTELADVFNNAVRAGVALQETASGVREVRVEFEGLLDAALKFYGTTPLYKPLQEDTGAGRSVMEARERAQAKEDERDKFLKQREDREMAQIKSKDNYIKALQEEADAIGKTRYELDLMFLASKNAEQQDYDLVQSMHERIRANEDAKKSEMDLADELERIEQRRMATQELRTFEESMAQRRISRQIDDLRSQQRGGGGQTPELMATESRFLSRGTVRSKDPIASALQKQIEKLEEQLKSMQRQEEELEEIRKNTMLQEALVGI